VSGNANGVPCVFLHGGPGAGCSPRCRRFFDPSFYRIVTLDQRGSGRSIPNAADDLAGSLLENNTSKLVGDVDTVRKHLKIRQWGLVLGGSWGSTLALAYAQAHPSRCSALVLRGVFLFLPEEVDYLFSSGGTAGQHPQAWEAYRSYIKDTSASELHWEREQDNLLGAYWERLTGEDKQTRAAAAAAFVGYELSLSKAFVDPAVVQQYLSTPSILVPFAVMEVQSIVSPLYLRPLRRHGSANTALQHAILSPLPSPLSPLPSPSPSLSRPFLASYYAPPPSPPPGALHAKCWLHAQGAAPGQCPHYVQPSRVHCARGCRLRVPTTGSVAAHQGAKGGGGGGGSGVRGWCWP
jgi:proline iminopeptidase